MATHRASNPPKARLRRTGLALAATLLLGSATAAVVMAVTKPALVSGGQLGAVAWYTNNYLTSTRPNGAVFDGTNIWVANGGANTVSKFDAATGNLVGSYATGANPLGIAFDGTNIYTTNSQANTVTKIVAATGVVAGTFSVGTTPYGIVYDGSSLWVSNQGSNNVIKMSTTGVVAGTFAVGNWPLGLAFDGNNIWVANQGSNTVTKLNNSGTVLGTYAVGTRPQGVAFDGANIWVANSGSNNVTKLNALQGSLVGTYAVGASPSALAFEQGGYSTSANPNYDPATYMWVTNNAEVSVSRINTSTGVVVGTYPTGRYPNFPVFDGTNVWIPNYGPGTLTKIRVR